MTVTGEGERTPRLFALDHNFPKPLVNALRDHIREAELVSIADIDPRMPDLDDWQVLLALHLHPRPWDGLVTSDDSMLNQPRELAVLHQTKLTLVVAESAGHDPLKASGLLLTHLPSICENTRREIPQVWRLHTKTRNPEKAWNCIGRLAARQKVSIEELFRAHRLTTAELSADPLGATTKSRKPSR